MVPMIARLAVVCGLMIGAVGQVSAQDPTKTLPDAYRVQFENDHVRVVRVHYPAGARLPEHTHPGGTTVYVYLNDSEDRKSTRLNSSHSQISYAVFCLKKKKKKSNQNYQIMLYDA